MKQNFFRLEVFKDGNKVFDQTVPTMIIVQVVAQWTAPELGYSTKMTFVNGTSISSDTLIDGLGAESIANFNHVLYQEIDNM